MAMEHTHLGIGLTEMDIASLINFLVGMLGELCGG